MFAGNRKHFPCQNFTIQKTVKSHQSLAMLYKCNNRAENELFNSNYIINALNNNKYSVIENNKNSLAKLGLVKLIFSHPKYVSKTDNNCHSSRTDFLYPLTHINTLRLVLFKISSTDSLLRSN